MNSFWKLIWDLAEFYKIDLGRFAPYVFGAMIGRVPHKIEKSAEGKAK